jgi:release factor glutamine methyltransferase
VIVTLALDQATSQLRAAGVTDAAWDAERLLRHLTGWDRAEALLRGSETLAPETRDAFFALVAERARRRPLQHLTGTQAFWRHEFLVTPDVLIPRPETEQLVETSLAALTHTDRPVIVDVGTGSGCIALSLAAERPDATVHAIDCSAAALAVARRNADRLGLRDRVRFHQADFLTPPPLAPGTADLIVSNPPYVDLAEIPELAPEVRDHEPRLALVPAGDRYYAYRMIVPQACPLLDAAGVLVLEVGQGMAERVVALCQESGLSLRSVLEDLQGIPRTVVTGKS